MVHYKKTAGDRIFEIVVGILVALVLVITIYPLLYVFSMSISDPMEAVKGHVWLLPKGFDLTAIRSVLKDKSLPVYYYNTIWYTFMATVLGILASCLAAYPLSRPEFRARGVLSRIYMFTMFFGGGLIPTYIVVTKFFHLFDTRWAIILPTLTSAWYIMVTKNYFQSLPMEIGESAKIDGAGEITIFAKLYMPLSKPILAVLALYFATGMWNAYFNPMIYLSSNELKPLALYVRAVVIQNSVNSVINAAEELEQELSLDQILSVMQLKYAVIIVAVLPMLLIYPFLSKYLEKGLMVGSVKG